MPADKPRSWPARALLGVLALAAVAAGVNALYRHDLALTRSARAQAASSNGASMADEPAVVQRDVLAGADLVKRGEYLARAGDCVACHTADKSRPFAGGLPISTPFGTIYTPNITSDADTGIGRWTDGDFLRAMQEGIGRGGARLYPAFPYAEYTKVTNEDVLAIRAYLNTLPPIHYTPPANEMPFPFNQRWLMVFWNMVNFNEGRFLPDPKRSAEWNRGAYLVKGLAHCEECHTPRNITQGLKSSDRFSGAVVSGWHAYNITPDRTGGVGAWSDDELKHYLATGVAHGRANAAGPMGDVVQNSTQYLSDEDLRSIVVYLRSVPPKNGGDTRARDGFGKPQNEDVVALRGTAVRGINGEQLFVANCASCHNWTGEGRGGAAPGAYPPLIHNSVVGAGAADNLTLVMLHGVDRQTAHATAFMPSFADALDDAQIAAISNYVTRTFGNPQWATNADQVAKLRATPQ
jgi:mono/diheme cytochrome c family protein